ncbi:USP [Symbiodinium sp. CCMP2456]|nr:USP [Symbiodinium sp. CCMP2456]
MVAWSDLLTEAVYSVVLREKPHHGPSLISYVWGGISCGRLLALLAVGEVMTHFGNRTSYLIATPMAVLSLLVPLMNLPQETRSRARCGAKLAGSELPLAIVAFITGCGTLGLALLSIFGGSLQTKVFAAACLAVLALGLVSCALSPIIAKMNAFFFIQNICSFGIGGISWDVLNFGFGAG